jgi:hypothetical protein
VPVAANPGGTAIGSTIPTAAVKGNAPQSRVPFRLATLERVETLPSLTPTFTASQQPFVNIIEGTGYAFGVMLDYINVTAANAAATAFFEDGPWSALASCIFSDPSGDILNLSGFDLFLVNLAHKNYATFDTQSTSVEIFSTTTGAGGTGGSFSFQLRVPAGINRRTLLGILGNQDRSVKYQLRTDLASGSGSAAGPVYTTAPTSFGTVTISRFYENYSVPPAVGPAGPQAIYPDGFGTLSFSTSTIDAAAPNGGSTVNHYLRRIGNTIRYIILVFRINGIRSTIIGNTAPPTRIQLKIGDTDLFNESWRYRRGEMYRRYGSQFDALPGVLVYDTLHDFVPGAGNELGMDWMNTQNVNTAQFIITYPASFGSTANTLKFVTNDLALVGQPVGS